MQVISHYQVRRVPGVVKRAEIAGRTVDFWSPARPSHLLIAHDGQNVFDPRTATRRNTWRMAQNAIKVFEEHGLTPPAIIAIFHSGSKSDIHGRAKDLSPQGAFEKGIQPLMKTELQVGDLRGDDYQQLIAEQIVPTVTSFLNFTPNFSETAMIGSSMGGLATLNALTLRPEFFKTALAFSPHWVLGGKPLAKPFIDIRTNESLLALTASVPGSDFNEVTFAVRQKGKAWSVVGTSDRRIIGATGFKDGLYRVYLNPNKYKKGSSLEVVAVVKNANDQKLASAIQSYLIK